MPIQQPGRGGGIQGRGVSARCGQGGAGGSIRLIGRNAGGMGREPIFATKQSQDRFGVSGISYDENDLPLPGVTVDLYSESRVWLDRTVSDGSGAYSFTGIGVGSVFFVAYLEGAPEVAGTTIHNVSPVVV